MTLQGRFVVLVVLALGMIAGCGNPFWDGASASYFQNGGDVQDPDDTGFDDGAVQQDAPDVRMGDATPPVDQGSDATPSEDRVDTGAFADALDTGDVGQDATFADVVGDEGLVPVDIPVEQDVADAGSAPDVPLDTTPSLDVVPMADVVVTPDRGQDTGVPDVGFDTTSVATDGGDAGPSDTGPTCPTGQTLCGGMCVNTTSSLDHCGVCGNACGMSIFPNMGRVCQSGQCGDTCVTGFANCDGTMGNGCEVDTRSNAQHCGTCGRGCSLANATPACLGGNCYIASCATGFANCDSNEVNGCETDTRSSAQHCGACGRVCAPMMHGSVACVNAQCAVTCNEGSFLEGGVCVQKDLVIEYRHQSMDNSLLNVPEPSAYVGLFSDGIVSGFASDMYQVQLCDAAPVPFTRNGVDWWRCSVARLRSDQVASSAMLLTLRVRCGMDRFPRSCPPRWNEQWRVILRGRVYESPRDTSRFVQYDACPYGGWSAGCVHLRLTP